MRIEQAVASITSREFNHDVGSAKRAAQVEPVIITDRGVPAYVLMTYEAFQRLRPAQRTLVDIFRMDDDIEIDFDPQPSRALPRPFDFDDA